MKTYARVQDGIVVEVIDPMAYDSDSPVGIEPGWKSGDEIPIASRYHPFLLDGTISYMVDITNVSPRPECWWTYDGKLFSPPNGA